MAVPQATGRALFEAAFSRLNDAGDRTVPFEMVRAELAHPPQPHLFPPTLLASLSTGALTTT